MDNQIVSIVNLLFLLKDEPKTKLELLNSGCFFGWAHLYKTIQICKNAGLIVRQCREWFEYDVSLGRRKFWDWFAITTLGLNFLKVYDNEKQQWHIQKYKRNVKQVAVS